MPKRTADHPRQLDLFVALMGEVPLRAFVGVGEIERWIAEQRWEALGGGWSVPAELHGCRFRVESVPGGVRVIASAAGDEPAVWFVPSRG